ncbi:MAG: choice-of-anchor Q domain-containing protein, partial [Gemmataceae bacterium]
PVIFLGHTLTLFGDATNNGGGIFNSDSGTVTVQNSTLSGNFAFNGGGIHNRLSGTVTVQNSTLSGNSAFYGGGIYNRLSGTVTVQNSTLSGNFAFNGGGIWMADGATIVNLDSTIVAGNTAGVGPDVHRAGGTLNVRHSLIQTTVSGGINGTNSNNLPVGTDPLLGPLQNNGGPTFTHALLPGSPAIDAGFNYAGSSFDQRGPGFPRTVNGTTDIGAFESQSLFAVGAGPGGGPHVRVYNADGSLRFSFFAFAPAFTGGVRVAVGDVNGDGTQDIIVGAGPGGGPHVRVFSGVDLTELASFFAFAPGFTGGVFVAAGNLNGDNFMEVIVGAGAGGGPHVRSFQISGGVATVLPGPLGNFFAYAPSFTGGVHVAAGNFDGIGNDEIITGAGAGGGPHVKAFRADGAVIASFFAYAPSFTGGVFVASADLDDNGLAEIITGAGAGGGPHVKVFNGGNANPVGDFFAYNAAFTGGVRVGTVRLEGGDIGILTGPGPGGAPNVRIFDGMTLNALDSFFAFDPLFTGGVFVGG